MLPEIVGYTRRGVPVYAIRGGDDTAAATAATVQGDAGQGDAGAGAGTGDAGGTGDDAVDEKDPAKLLALVAKLRPFEKETRSLRATNAQQAKELKAFQDAQLTEAEKATKRISELEAENAKLKTDVTAHAIKGAFAAAAAKAGAIYPDDVYRLVDLARVEIADGQPTNLDALISEIRKARPNYFRAGAGSASSNGSADAGARQGGAPAGVDMDKVIRGLGR